MEYFNSVENIMWLIWLAIGVGFILAELMAPGFIVIFFGVGALIAGATAFFGFSLQLQIVVFGVSSLALLLLLRRFMAPIFLGSASSEGDIDGGKDRAIGGLAEVVEPIKSPQPGRIKFQGTFWTATADTTIETGTMVRIISRDPEDHNTFTVQKEN
ncbi:NfeD family protein [Pseudodesulfovibrio sp.]|nr:NfeD family protein [Pseudodesulfovibrio sp.]